MSGPIPPGTPAGQLEPPTVVVVEAEQPAPVVVVAVVAEQPAGCLAVTNGGSLPCRLVAGHSGPHQLTDGTVFLP